jgi:hypothetical protein
MPQQCFTACVARDADGARASPGGIGGAADEAGGEYRRAVAAYAAAHGLVGEPLRGFGVPTSEAQVTAVSLETDAPVDDIRIDFASGWCAYVQVRRAIRRGRSLDKALEQWQRAATEGLDRSRERLVLVTSEMSGGVRDLKHALDRARNKRAGAPTEGQASALRYLDAKLQDLTPEQRGDVRDCALIHILFTEEEELEHAREGALLLGRVVAHGDGQRAWRDLIRIAGGLARARTGFTAEEWLSQLRDAGHRILAEGETVSAGLEQKRLALERYRSQIERRGTRIDLRAIGAPLAPLNLEEVDAEVDVTAAGEDSRSGRDLLWAFLRRGRVVLTGLPGGGKSTAVAVTAARLLGVPEAALPVVASLRDVDRDRSGRGFTARLLDVATRDL